MFLLETTNLKSITSGFQSTLKSGSRVVFSVINKSDTNMYKILLLGKFLTVKSTNKLKVGSKVKAEVLRTKSGLQLKVLNKSISDVTSVEKTSNTKQFLIAEALIRSNMPLDPSYFNKLLPLLGKYKKSDQKYLRILLLLIDKGIPLNEENIKEILEFSNTDNFGKRNSDKNKKNNTKNSIEKNTDSIKEDLKKQILNTDTENGLLKYFNHAIAIHDNWLIIPLNYSFIRPGEGLLKLRLNENLQVTNMVLNLSDGNNWEFNLEKFDSEGKMKVWGPENSPWEKTDVFIKLKEKLYNMGIVFDDINKEKPVTDGFTEIIHGKIESIDLKV
jgi:hypothetical protein